MSDSSKYRTTIIDIYGEYALLRERGLTREDALRDLRTLVAGRLNEFERTQLESLSGNFGEAQTTSVPENLKISRN